MNISDFEIAKVYTRDDLISAFRGSFMRGMNMCNRTNTLVLISKHTTNRIYGDQLCENDDRIIYTGEGQRGDQTMSGANKTLNEAAARGISVHLFIVEVRKQYKYYGLVSLAGEPYYEQERDVDGKLRNVIRFPLARKSDFQYMREEEALSAYVRGIVIPDSKPHLNVVGAAIIDEKGKILCAQRGHGSLVGKWEFPGGKVNFQEDDKEALKREIKEELDIDIEVGDLIDEYDDEDKAKTFNLKVYKCKYLTGTINDEEHQELRWVDGSDLLSLDLIDADRTIAETYVNSLPATIDERVMFNYFEAEAMDTSNREQLRAVQDYERSERNKRKAGEAAELAVLRYERAKLNNAGRPDLADKVRWVAKESSDYGYDILSFDLNNDGNPIESHIEVKSVKKPNRYIEFFISENELKKFKEQDNHKIYCLYKVGRNYKLHEVNKNDFFRNEYLTPMTYRVRIRVTE